MIGVGWISGVTQGRPEAELCLRGIHYIDQPVPGKGQKHLGVALQQNAHNQDIYINSIQTIDIFLHINLLRV